MSTLVTTIPFIIVFTLGSFSVSAKTMYICDDYEITTEPEKYTGCKEIETTFSRTPCPDINSTGSPTNAGYLSKEEKKIARHQKLLCEARNVRGEIVAKWKKKRDKYKKSINFSTIKYWNVINTDPEIEYLLILDWAINEFSSCKGSADASLPRELSHTDNDSEDINTGYEEDAKGSEIHIEKALSKVEELINLKNNHSVPLSLIKKKYNKILDDIDMHLKRAKIHNCDSNENPPYDIFLRWRKYREEAWPFSIEGTLECYKGSGYTPSIILKTADGIYAIHGPAYKKLSIYGDGLKILKPGLNKNVLLPLFQDAEFLMLCKDGTPPIFPFQYK